MARLELARRAQRDLARLDGPRRSVARRGLEQLGRGADNLDLRPLAGRRPWMRLRIGDLRILYRPLTADEMRSIGAAEDRVGFLGARIVDRAHLEKAARQLERR